MDDESSVDPAILTYKSFDEADGADWRRHGRPARWLHLQPRQNKTIDRFIGELSLGGARVNLVNVTLSSRPCRRRHRIRRDRPLTANMVRAFSTHAQIDDDLPAERGRSKHLYALHDEKERALAIQWCEY